MQATTEDVADLARLIQLDHAGREPDEAPGAQTFAGDLARWWTVHAATHFAFVARTSSLRAVGMAWVALVPRVPRPDLLDRVSADIQTVYVEPEHRGQGLGAAVVEAATQHAIGLGAVRVTVHSGRRAVPVYERLGFASSRQLLQRTPPAENG